MHAKIKVRKPKEWDFSIENKQEKDFEKDEKGNYKRIETTVGRLIFNYEIPIPRELRC